MIPPADVALCLLTLAGPFVAGGVGGVPDGAGAPVDFDRDVRPILARNCFACHGPDGAAREAGLRLDRREDVLGVAVPGDPDGSLLVRRVAHADPAERMPPPDTDRSLTSEQVDLLRRWVAEGLPWAGHWAFEPVADASVPGAEVLPAGAEAWVRDDLDRFVLRTLAERGLAPSVEAEPAKLLRRVHLDLTGLPPTAEELDAFLADPSDAAYARAVDALLASDRHAEHLAAWWLDGARYADTNGYQNDFARGMWPWRDWVLGAFRSNQPYDAFLVEQMAGDLLPDATLEQRVATGFHRNHRMVTEAGSLDEEWRVENVADRVETTATVFLGLTVGCARCHDHKYDPITQRDYYRFFAYFDNVDEQGVYTETRGNVPPLVSVPDEGHRRETARLEGNLARAREELERTEVALREHLPEHEAAFLREHPGRAPLTLPETLRITSAEVLGGAGPVRSALPHVSLPGEDGRYVDLGRALAFEQERAFSLSVWVRLERPGTLVSRMADDDTYRGFDLLVMDDGRLQSHLIHDWPENAIKVETGESLSVGRWTHVAYSYDGSRKAAGVRIALDGREVPLQVHADTLDGTLATDTPLRLGRRHYTRSFGGGLADLTFFAGVLDDGAREAVRVRRVLDLREASGAAEDPAAREPLRSEFQELLLSCVDGSASTARAEVQRLERELATQQASAPTAMVLAERAERRPTHLLRRGRYDMPDESEVLAPGLPEFLGVREQPRDRLELARWMVSGENPLTARVLVNQTWQRLFGRGLVETVENLGVQGARPTHPELLDHLATGLVRSGWDLRALERRIVTSATYRQASAASPAAFAADPDNRWLARGARHRLGAEALRDQALFLGGLLVERLGGPPTRPYQPAGLWEELAGGAGQGPYVQDTGEGLFRRSLYTHRKRTVPHPSLSTFDAPGFEVCQVRRSRTNTPLQALALLNDVTYVEAARGLGDRMGHVAAGDAARGLTFGFRSATGRAPDGDELALLERALCDARDGYRADPAAARTYLGHGATGLDPEALAARGEDLPSPDALAERAAWARVGSLLLNLDETLTRE